MSRNLFAKAVEDAGFSVATSQDGSRNLRVSNTPRQESDSFSQRKHLRGRHRGRGSYRGRGRHHRTENNVHPRSYLADEDDDCDMEASVQNRSNTRFNPYSTRPPSRQGIRLEHGRSSDVKSRLGPFPASRSNEQQDWHKVVIHQGEKHDKEWLIRKLQSASDQAFQPVNFHYIKGESAAFFVEGQKIAAALKNVSHKITVRDGSKLIVMVRPSAPPRFANTVRSDDSSNSMNEETKKVLKDCLSKRYDVEMKALNLTDLFHDKVLTANNIQGVLSWHWLASGIVQVIGENCPDVQSLDISNNRLSNLEGFKELHIHAPSLKHLKISNNQLRGVEELDKIKGLNHLVSLHLEDNPLCEKFQLRESSYVSAIRGRFPKVASLDGHSLPPLIGFDLPGGEALPPSKGSFLGSDPQIKKLIETFLEQYFKVYDSGDRQGLLEAYHDQAIFSLCVNTGTMAKDKSRRAPSLGEYMKNSRNMKRLSEPEKRSSLIKHTRLSVVALLNELPLTKHDLTSFDVDLSLTLPTCLTFAVRGLFMENSKILRSFSRVFVAVPAAGGKALSIINDELHIRNALPGQLEKTSNKTDLSGCTETLSDTSTATLGPAVPEASQATTPQQQQMVLQFSEQSTMNIEWSYKCLSENLWDYEKAALAFTSSKNNGSIPPEAFVK